MYLNTTQTVIIELQNYLLMRFNDYDVSLQMTAEEVRNLIEQFISEYIQ